MPVDPQLAQLLPLLNANPMSRESPQTARDQFRAAILGPRPHFTAPDIAGVEELSVDGAEGPLQARAYRPHDEGPRPTLVFFHGGGFVIGDLDTHDYQCRALCRDGGAVVLSVDYRLAPEAPFPAGVEDALASTRWAAENIDRLGADAGRIAVGGDSAGGNLAAVTALRCRDEGLPLAAQLLIYPVCDFVDVYASYEENATGYYLTIEDMRWFNEQYIPPGAELDDPRLSPLRADSLAGAAPAIVVVAEYDPLRDNGAAYAHALRDAGVPTTLQRADGLIHGFLGLVDVNAAAAQAGASMGAQLRRVLATSATAA